MTGLKLTINEKKELYKLPKEDIKYLEIAFNHIKDMIAPAQSNFRVVSVITYYNIEMDDYTSDTFHYSSPLRYVIGCNAEPSQMEGSLCSERNGLLQLCALHPRRNFMIDSVYVITDHHSPVMCGSLCLEFISALASPFTRMIFAARDTQISGSGNSNSSSSSGNTSGGRDGEKQSLLHYQFYYLKDLYLFPSLLKFVPFPTPPKLKVFSDILLQHSKDQMKTWPQQWWKLYRHTLEHWTTRDNKTVYTLNQGVGVLCADGKSIFGNRYKTLEYGASMPPMVSVLPQLIEYLLKNKTRVEVIMIVDQYGVLHPPNAQTRALLYEHGLGKAPFAFHYQIKNGDQEKVDWYGWEESEYHHYIAEYIHKQLIDKEDEDKELEVIKQHLLGKQTNLKTYGIVVQTIEQMLPLLPSGIDTAIQEKLNHTKAKL